MIVRSAFGETIVRVALDDALRPDVVDLPFYDGCPSLQLLDASAFDPLTGVPALDGLPVQVMPENS